MNTASGNLPDGRISAMSVIGIIVAVAAATGCGGDVVSNQGTLGNLVYALHTDYNVSEVELKDARLITGVQHRITVGLTSQGASIGEPWTIFHKVDPSSNASVETDSVESGRVAVGDALVKVDVPGEYTLMSWKGRELVDYTPLNFAEADRLDLVVYVRQPDEDTFALATSDTITIGRGGQATFVAKPVDSDGNELVGDIGLQIASEPEWGAIQVYNLDGVYENGIWGREIPLNLVLVEYGTIKVTLTEPLTGMQAVINFEVPLPAE